METVASKNEECFNNSIIFVNGNASAVAIFTCLCCGTLLATYLACFPRGNTSPLCHLPLYARPRLDSTFLGMLERLMEGNSNSTGLEWENLALYTGNPIPIPIPNQLGFSVPSSNEFGSCSGDPVIGLGVGGQQKEYGFPSASSSRALISSIPVSSMPTKRSRASYHNMQNPCCQVEGCNLDLKLAKDYHRRHRICETHSKSPKVIVAGMERRFCQQCSRFHDLSEFDDKKRSCRRRLSDHNARRRRVQPDSVQLTSPALYADQRQQNVLLNGLPVSLSNSTWENALISRPSKPTLSFSNDDISNLHMDPHRSNPRILDHCLHLPSTNSSMAPDLLSAHSLLSSNTWSLNEGEPPASMEGIVHGGYAPVLRHSEAEQHHLTLFQSNNAGNIGGDQNLHNAGPSHHQEYQLFKSPYDSASFYSSQRSL